ncbi:hypothetical protein F4818DRAFT_395637 [Hypoxylon cercidicola]|nr:hypothetical protein F4818DRAFT_395637 [Hypoxylon cercidicola]
MDTSQMGPTKVITAGAVLVTITALAMASRFMARCTLKTLGVDDFLIVVSWIVSLGLCSCIIAATRYGLGSHRNEVSDENYNAYLKLQMASSITYSWSVAAAKASFAILYLRIFPEGGFRLVNKILIAFLLAQATAETCVVLLRCRPVQKAWDFHLEGSCFGLPPLWYCTFSFNIMTDLILFIEPIPSTWKLQLPLFKRLGLITMLSLGLLVTSISVIRIVFVTGIGTDDTYQLVEPFIWSVAEICTLIICSCIPSLRQVFAKIPRLNSVLGLSSGESKMYHGYPGPNKFSIQLQSRGRPEYTQSQRSRARSRGGQVAYGMTSRAVGAAMDGISENDSQEEIFPYGGDQTGAIMVTTEIQHHVESSPGPFTFTDGLSQHDSESRHSPERTSRNSQTSNHGDINWLPR